jgi:hypothetical protein
MLPLRKAMLAARPRCPAAATTTTTRFLGTTKRATTTTTTTTTRFLGLLLVLPLREATMVTGG